MNSTRLAVGTSNLGGVFESLAFLGMFPPRFARILLF